MTEYRIEIISPGGLPSGITEDKYLSGKLSVLRNRNLANVFYRLGFVEIFGTGITRIKQLYEEGLKQPDFEESENATNKVFSRHSFLKLFTAKSIILEADALFSGNTLP